MPPRTTCNLPEHATGARSGTRRDWAFFSHCCNARGGNQRKYKVCASCDMMNLVLTAYIRGPSFCTKLGIDIFESINGSVAANAPNMSDFSLTHHPRAQMLY